MAQVNSEGKDRAGKDLQRASRLSRLLVVSLLDILPCTFALELDFVSLSACLSGLSILESSAGMSVLFFRHLCLLANPFPTLLERPDQARREKENRCVISPSRDVGKPMPCRMKKEKTKQ